MIYILIAVVNNSRTSQDADLLMNCLFLNRTDLAVEIHGRLSLELVACQVRVVGCCDEVVGQSVVHVLANTEHRSS